MILQEYHYNNVEILIYKKSFWIVNIQRFRKIWHWRTEFIIVKSNEQVKHVFLHINFML